MKNVIQKYESIMDFLHDCEQKPIAPFYEMRKASINGTPKFCGTKSWEEACILLTRGDTETADRINKQLLPDTHKIRSYKTKSVIKSGPIGFIPNVPAYLVGRPDNMYNVTTKPYRNSKVLNIVEVIATSYKTEAEYLAEFGGKVLAALLALEAEGYRINLYMTTCAKFKRSGENYGMCVLKIKDSGKPLNLTRVAYPIANPSMFRRHSFRWIEINGELLKADGYGVPQGRVKAKELLNVTIKNAMYLGFIEDGNKSIEELISELKKQSNIL